MRNPARRNIAGQHTLNGGFMAKTSPAGNGREGEIVNGRFGAFQFAEPGLG